MIYAHAEHDKMRSGADLRGRSPLVSFNHVIDPHFVTLSNSLYTTIRNSNPNRSRNPTVITEPQIGPRGPQIVTFRSAPFRILSPAPGDAFSFCKVQLLVSSIH